MPDQQPDQWERLQLLARSPWSYEGEDIEAFRWAVSEITRLRALQAADPNSITLLMKGMESQAEIADGLKQKVREQEAEIERLKAACEGYQRTVEMWEAGS